MEKYFPRPQTNQEWHAKCLTCGIRTRHAYRLDLVRKLRNVHEWQFPGHKVKLTNYPKRIEHIELEGSGYGMFSVIPINGKKKIVLECLHYNERTGVQRVAIMIDAGAWEQIRKIDVWKQGKRRKPCSSLNPSISSSCRRNSLSVFCPVLRSVSSRVGR